MAPFLYELLRDAKVDADRHETAQHDWQQAEWIARAAFALTRLEALDALHVNLTRADRFDAAYAIWDDYIDGRRDDERINEATGVELTEAAMIFARVLVHIGTGPDAVELARAAWGRRIFEVFLFDTPSDTEASGKFGWYPNDPAVVVTRLCRCGRHGARDVYTEAGLARSVVRGMSRIALHPVFGVRS